MDGRKDVQDKAILHIKEVKRHIDPYAGEVLSGEEYHTGSLTVLLRSLQDVFEHGKEDMHLMNWLKDFSLDKVKGWEYQGWAENRPYASDHLKYDPKNPDKKKHPETEYFTYYSLDVNGRTYWANVKVHKYMRKEILYTIEKDKPKGLIHRKRE